MLRLVLACLAWALIAAPAAIAATPTQILRDCEDDGVLQGSYSVEELRDARRRIPTDLDQYSNCRDVLARASADRAAGGGGATGGAGGSAAGGGGAPAELAAPRNEAEEKALRDAGAGGPGPLSVGGEQIVLPGAAGFAPAAVRNDLPAPLIALLALLALGAVAAAVPAARRRLPPSVWRVLRRG